jgi:phytanoyl-CoA hydroxylase
MLNNEQIEHYQTQGFVVLNNFAPINECDAMRKRANALVLECGPKVDPRSAYDALSKRSGFLSEEYFFESTNAVRLFFEKSAVAPDGKLLVQSTRAIVKIGHALHDYDPVFLKYSHSRRMHEIARVLGYKKPLIGQSRYFFRRSEIKMEIPPHQDSTLLYTEPTSCYAVWLALEAVTVHNGCMWVIPGSHRAGLRRRFVKDPVSKKAYFVSKNNSDAIDESAFIPLEVDQGAAVLMSGELIHKSNQNMSTTSRQAYALHFIEGHESHRYPADNWLQCIGGFSQLQELS